MGKRKVSFLQRVGYILEYIVVVPLAFFISLIPRFAYPFTSRFLGWIAFHLNSKDKKWAYYNLDIIYKDNPKSSEEKDRIVRELYRNLVRFGIEYIKLGRINAKNFHKYAILENFEAVTETEKKGKGVLVVTLHLGNWEMMGAVAAKLGSNVGAVINRQFNPYTDHWLKRLRENRGKIKCFYNEISEMKKVARHLRDSGVMALLADQTYYFKPIFVPFFGMNSATADGPAKLHLKFGAPIVMAYCLYDHETRKYTFRFEDPVTFEKTGDVKADHKKIMTWINEQYEENIRKNPEQWFSLLHARWERTKPEEFEALDFDPW